MHSSLKYWHKCSNKPKSMKNGKCFCTDFDKAQIGEHQVGHSLFILCYVFCLYTFSCLSIFYSFIEFLTASVHSYWPLTSRRLASPSSIGSFLPFPFGYLPGFTRLVSCLKPLITVFVECKVIQHSIFNLGKIFIHSLIEMITKRL